MTDSGNPAADPRVPRIAFAKLRGLTPLVASQLLERFGTPEEFFATPASELRRLCGRDWPMFDDAYRASQLAKAQDELRFVNLNHVDVLWPGAEGYPHRLAQAEDAPQCLFRIGTADLDAPQVLAVVGTRHATPYGQGWIDRTIEELGRQLPGLLVVSGLAYGIDGMAHRACLRCGVATVAVMAHGLDRVYPPEHRSLAADIIHHGGAMVTEYATSDPIHRGNFPARNRIVAALADAVLVVESARKGGAMITASLGMAYQREVLALPGRVNDPYSAGCNHLIATSQARLVRDAAEIMEILGWQSAQSLEGTQRRMLVEPTPQQRSILDLIRQMPEATLSDMSVRLSIPMGALRSELMEMEFADMLVSLPGGRYAPKM